MIAQQRHYRLFWILAGVVLLIGTVVGAGAVLDAARIPIATGGRFSRVDLAFDGIDGLWLAREQTYDVIVLDLMLPGLGGLQLCATLRAEQIWTPVLVLAARACSIQLLQLSQQRCLTCLVRHRAGDDDSARRNGSVGGGAVILSSCHACSKD